MSENAITSRKEQIQNHLPESVRHEAIAFKKHIRLVRKVEAVKAWERRKLVPIFELQTKISTQNTEHPRLTQKTAIKEPAQPFTRRTSLLPLLLRVEERVNESGHVRRKLINKEMRKQQLQTRLQAA